MSPGDVKAVETVTMMNDLAGDGTQLCDVSVNRDAVFCFDLIL